MAFIRAVLAVLSAFIGIRKGESAKKDTTLRPIHFIVAGICMVLLFITIVRFAVKFALQS